MPVAPIHARMRAHVLKAVKVMFVNVQKDMQALTAEIVSIGVNHTKQNVCALLEFHACISKLFPN